MVPEADIGNESFVGRVTKESFFPLVPSHCWASNIPSVPLTFGGTLADVLIQHVGWFGLARLERGDFSASRVPDVPKSSNDHILYVK